MVGTTDGEGKYNLGPFPYDVSYVSFMSRWWEQQTARANTTSGPSLMMSALGAVVGTTDGEGKYNLGSIPYDV
jgi:hypothetical protein